MNPILVLLYFGKSPHHQYTTLAPNVLVTFGRTSPMDRRFEGQEERGGSLIATSRGTRELGEKEVEV